MDAKMTLATARELVVELERNIRAKYGSPDVGGDRSQAWEKLIAGGESATAAIEERLRELNHRSLKTKPGEEVRAKLMVLFCQLTPDIIAPSPASYYRRRVGSHDLSVTMQAGMTR